MYKFSFYVVEHVYTFTAQCLFMFMLTERNNTFLGYPFFESNSFKITLYESLHQRK